MFTSLRQLAAQANSLAVATFCIVAHDITACVIATAARGTAMQREIHFLESYRERRLARYVLGIQLLKLYYLVSIPLVKVLSKNHRLMASAQLLLKPLLSVLRIMIKVKFLG